MISFLSSFVIKSLLLYLIVLVLRGACSSKRIVQAQMNSLYASFSKCFNFSCKAIFQKINIETVKRSTKFFCGKPLKIPDLMIVDINL